MDSADNKKGQEMIKGWSRWNVFIRRSEKSNILTSKVWQGIQDKERTYQKGYIIFRKEKSRPSLHSYVNNFAITHTELRFVATVMTSSRVKFVPAVYIFPENNAISPIICEELPDLHTPSVFALKLLKFYTLVAQLNSYKTLLK